LLDSLDLELAPAPVAVTANRSAAIVLATPSAATAYAAICPTSHESGSGVVMGRVRDVDERTPLADADIATEWTNYLIVGGRAAGHRVHADVHTNRGGVYLLCGVPTRVPLELHAELAGFSAGPALLALDDRLMRRVDFAVSRRDSAALAIALGDSGGARRGTASLKGAVRGADGQALRDAVVEVVGTVRSARTDAAGAFLLEGIPAGTRTIEARSIGFLPEHSMLDFETNAARDTALTISRRAQDLKADTVKAAVKVLSAMETDGFAERRRHALGAYLIASDIARHQYPNLGTVLGEMRGVHLERDGRGAPVVYLNGTIAGYCPPNVYLDGTLYMQSPTAAGIQSGAKGSASPTQRIVSSGSFDELSLIARPDLIKGIEIYTSPGTIPAQYDMMSSTGCGSIVIWTR
jgi:hypothetical protein